MDSTQRALRDLAKYYKKKFPIPVVALTGSVGKTTTKDMVAAVLGEKYRVLKTEGNLNNEIGVPMTLLRLSGEHEIAVLELGMNHAGEIDYLSALVEPAVVLMTNIGDSHIEHFGSREKILEAKSEIFHHVKSGAFVVINGDDPLLNTLPGKLPYAFTRVGAGEGLDYRAEGLVSDGKSHMTCEVKTPHNSFRVEIPALGDHMIYPTLMAAAVGEHFGLTQTQIADGVLHFAPTKMRMNLLHRGDDITILNDTYNANPQSVTAALEVLGRTDCERRVAVLGDMGELGDLTDQAHFNAGALAAMLGIDFVIAIGSKAARIADGAAMSGGDVVHFATKEEALPTVREQLRPNTSMLIKASHSMRFERLTEDLRKYYD